MQSMILQPACFQTTAQAVNDAGGMNMRFTKMHGIGNDYLYFFCEPPENVRELAVRLSDRRKGVGSDGLIYICHSDIADYRMRIFNADGSEAKMCGNGIRCVGKYLFDNGIADKTTLCIETGSGVRKLDLEVKEDSVCSVSVDIGTASVSQPVSAVIDGMELEMIPVSVGNPHAVIFTDENGLRLPEIIGEKTAYHPMFDGGVNAEFVQVISPDRLRMRVYERGSGITAACGTGASASAAAAVYTGLCRYDEPVTVELDGGELEITVSRDMNVRMKGPASFVYEADIEMYRE